MNYPNTAFPTENKGPVSHNYGLTKREYTAIKIAQGLASSEQWTNSTPEMIAHQSIRLADALLLQLDLDDDIPEGGSAIPL